MAKRDADTARAKLKKVKVITTELSVAQKKALKIKELKMPSKPKTDQDFERIHLVNYRNLTKIIKKFETFILAPKNKNNFGGIYQLVSLYAQLRETTSELRAATNINEQVENLVDMVMKPLFKELAQGYTDKLYQLKMQIRPRLGTKQKEVFDIIDLHTRDLGELLQTNYNESSSKLRSLMLDDPDSKKK